MIRCPACHADIPDSALVSEAGRLMRAARKPDSNKGGAPRSRKRRCPCGDMTLRRAIARGHKCPTSPDESDLASDAPAPGTR